MVDNGSASDTDALPSDRNINGIYVSKVTIFVYILFSLALAAAVGCIVHFAWPCDKCQVCNVTTWEMCVNMSWTKNECKSLLPSQDLQLPVWKYLLHTINVVLWKSWVGLSTLPSYVDSYITIITNSLILYLFDHCSKFTVVKNILTTSHNILIILAMQPSSVNNY